MSKQIIKLKCGGTPYRDGEARLLKNSIGEMTITTKVQYNNPVIGRFLKSKDSDGYAEIELQKDVYLVYQDGKRYTFTVGTSVEIEDI